MDPNAGPQAPPIGFLTSQTPEHRPQRPPIANAGAERPEDPDTVVVV